jgi:hypothetical protein
MRNATTSRAAALVTCTFCGAQWTGRSYVERAGYALDKCPACVAEAEIERLETRLLKARRTAESRRGRFVPNPDAQREAQLLLTAGNGGGRA